MGVDKPDVRLLVHWGSPASPEAYYQQSGRAGRDGERARCVLFHSPADFSRLQMFAAGAHEATQREALVKAAAAMRSFAHTNGCRRAAILTYLGEGGGAAAPAAGWSGSIRCCDNCARGSRPTCDAGAEARALLRAVGACGGRFGLGTALELVRGSKTQKLASKAGGRLVRDAAFGCGAAFKQPVEWWRALADALLEQGLLRETLVTIGGAGGSAGWGGSGFGSSFSAIGIAQAADALLARGSDASPAPLMLHLPAARVTSGSGAASSSGAGVGGPSAARGGGASAAAGPAAASSEAGLSAGELRLLSELRQLRLLPDGAASAAGAADQAAGGGGGAKDEAADGEPEPAAVPTAGEALSDRCLRALVRARPSDPETLAAVSGMDPARCGGPAAECLLGFLRTTCTRLGLTLDVLSEAEHTGRLVRRLREARATQAVRDDVAPYMIVGDAQLALIASARPGAAGERERGDPRTPGQQACPSIRSI